jgi:transcriptional regulator with AAA-type ATPase domain
MRSRGAKKKEAGEPIGPYKMIEDLFGRNIQTLTSDNLKQEIERHIGKSLTSVDYTDMLVGYAHWAIDKGEANVEDRFRRYILPALEKNNEIFAAASLVMRLVGMNDLNFIDLENLVRGIYYVTFSKNGEVNFSGTYGEAESPEFKPYLYEELYAHAKYHDDPLLIIGKTGTGKELVCRAIHMLSERRLGPFIEINCSAIPETLLEAELFGVIGDYPGFHHPQPQKGKIELANNGVLFLDEIGKMAKPLQAKLLKVIEDRVVWPLGSPAPVRVDVRFISAAQPGDLKPENLLPDLKWRLDFPNVIKLSTLNEWMGETKDKGETIILCSLKDVLRRMGRRADEFTLNAASMKILKSHQYEGNYRELANILKSAILKNIVNSRTSFKEDISPPKKLKIEDFLWVKEFLNEPVSDKNDFPSPPILREGPVKLRDILLYAKGKAASIVEERLLDILNNRRDIKSEWLAEGNLEKEYQTFLKKATHLMGKSIRDLKKMVS